MGLDKLPLRTAIKLMLSEEAQVPARLLQQLPTIEKSLNCIVGGFLRGGRLFYVGAGTSGRLGVLDASECPPTFRTAPELVQGIIAGGRRALWESIEGGEDDAEQGAREIKIKKITRTDVVVGIAASGTTPFVWGALAKAKERGATTVLICFNPWLKIPRALRPTVVIASNLGPEVLTGSTRLKAGTATKLLLNLFSTLSMVRLGKVISNLMIDLDPTNTKLQGRAIRVLQALTATDEKSARAALESTAWEIRKAVCKLAFTRIAKPD
jgi:N-acetylmuramic acid 6-phosphate etherase